MPLLNFFGRDMRFFDLLENSAAEAKVGATLLGKLAATLGNGNTDILLGDIAESRRKHKRIATEISEELTKVFMTPIDREDIENLSGSLYRISKTVEKAAERLTICPPGAKLGNLGKELGAIEHAATVVTTLVGQLRGGVTLANIKDAHERVQSLEGDADKQLLEHMRDLYRNETDARLLIFWKDLYDLLEKITDRCRDVGNDIFHIALKNS
ncbi:MAG: hypothetical protein RL088_1683 [Verrucomicrobiota bacterium]|jgi:uncharacterized protein Yka (UPF0111/DUF47 family)